MNDQNLLLQNIIKHCTFFEACSKNYNNNNNIDDDSSNTSQIPTSLLSSSSSSGVHFKQQFQQQEDTNNKNEDCAATTSSSQIPIKLFNKQEVFSVSMSERKQREIDTHCGARTLFVSSANNEKNENEILLRGANKFFDLQNAFHQIPSLMNSSSSSLQKPYTIIPLRKAAGFFCIFFSDDGKDIKCASKHSLSGIHVDVALELFLKGVTNKDQIEELAKFLFADKFVLLCECILPRKKIFEKFASFHPSDDSDLLQETEEGKLTCFAIQKMNTVAEWSMDFDEFSSLFKSRIRKVSSSLVLVPKIDSSSKESLSDTVFELVARATMTTVSSSSSDTKNESQILKGEGAVLLIDGHDKEKKNDNNNFTFSKPIRIKIKTSQYQCARQVRSLFEQNHNNINSLQQQISTPLVLAIALYWYHHQAQRKNEVKNEVLSWQQIQEHFFNSHHQSLRSNLIQKLNRDSCLRYRAQLLNSKFLILLCGLPGSGKSSVSKALKDKLTSIFNNNIHITIIERDSFVPTLPPGSSNHALRAARKSAHRGFMKALRLGTIANNTNDGIIKFSLPSSTPQGTPHIIIADACHASVGARQTTRDCVAPYRMGVTCHLHCPDRKKLVLRILKRKGHRVLAGGEQNVANVEKAIFDVASSFVPPSQLENGGDAFLKINNVLETSPAVIADQIYENHLKSGIEQFMNEMKKVEKLCGFENEEEKQEEEVIYNWKFFQDNFLISSPTTTSFSSLKDLFKKISPPPPLLTVRLIPPKETQNQEWKMFLVQKVLEPILQKVLLNDDDDNILVGGHTKWVRPYFSLSASSSSSCFENIVRKFSSDNKRENSCEEESQEEEKENLHVTLLHSNDFEYNKIPDEIAQFWIQQQQENSLEHQTTTVLYKIKPTFVAIDRRMIAVEVEVNKIGLDDKTQEQTHHQELLHITVAYNSLKAKPSYAIELLSKRKVVGCVTSEGVRRRDREPEKDKEENSETTMMMSKNQKRKNFDGQYCIFKVPGSNNSEEVEEEDNNCLFGVVQCLSKK